MAITVTKYGRVGGHFADGDIIWASSTIKAALLTSSYTPDYDAHEFFSSITNQLTTANGYTAGGATLGSKSKSYIPADKQSALLAANTVWTPASGETLTARYCVVYKDTGTAGTSCLICLVDFGENKSATGAAFTIDWNDTGGVAKI